MSILYILIIMSFTLVFNAHLVAHLLQWSTFSHREAVRFLLQPWIFLRPLITVCHLQLFKSLIKAGVRGWIIKLIGTVNSWLQYDGSTLCLSFFCQWRI